MGIVVETRKSVLVFDSTVLCDFCQINGLPILVYLANFYKIWENLLYICFIVFGLSYIGSILLYQFVNQLERFWGRIHHLNLLLGKIDSAGFISYLAFYAAEPGLGICLIEKWLVLNLDNLHSVCYHYTTGF